MKLEFYKDDDLRAYDFRIVHHFVASPKKKIREEGCYESKRKPGLQLDEYMGSEGLVRLLYFLDHFSDEDDRGPWVQSAREFTELVRRLRLPYYEEARQYWHRAKTDGFFADFGDIRPYTQETLQAIIKKYEVTDHDR